MNIQHTAPTEYRKLLTMYGFSNATIVEHTRYSRIEIKVQQISKQELIKIAKHINDVKPASIHVTIIETNPKGNATKHTYDTVSVMSENKMQTENIDIKTPNPQPYNEKLLTEIEKNYKTAHKKKTVSEVKKEYVSGEITILELEKRLEEVLDPEPIAID